MQVPRRHRDGAGRRRTAAPLEPTRVGAAGRQHLELVVDVPGFGHVAEPPVDLVVRDDAGVLQLDRNALAEFGDALARLEAGDVIGDGGVDREHEVGVKVDAQRLGAAEADLLLGGRREVNGRRRRRQAARGLRHHEDGDAVLQRPPGDDPPTRVVDWSIETGSPTETRSSTASASSPRSTRPSSTDASASRSASSSVCGGTEPMTPGRSPLGVDGHALRPELPRVPAAQRVQLEDPVVVDVPDHDADLVHVGGDDVVVGLALDGADQVPHRVRATPVDVRLDSLPTPVADAVRVARHPSLLGERDQKLVVETALRAPLSGSDRRRR